MQASQAIPSVWLLKLKSLLRPAPQASSGACSTDPESILDEELSGGWDQWQAALSECMRGRDESDAWTHTTDSASSSDAVDSTTSFETAETDRHFQSTDSTLTDCTDVAEMPEVRHTPVATSPDDKLARAADRLKRQLAANVPLNPYETSTIGRPPESPMQRLSAAIRLLAANLTRASEQAIAGNGIASREPEVERAAA